MRNNCQTLAAASAVALLVGLSAPALAAGEVSHQTNATIHQESKTPARLNRQSLQATETGKKPGVTASRSKSRLTARKSRSSKSRMVARAKAIRKNRLAKTKRKTQV
jgi:hypothetical protein